METAPTIDSLVQAGNRFGFRLLSQLAEQDAGNNLFISSFSVALALAMAYNGARGETLQAMAETLGIQGLSLEEINAAHAALLSLQDGVDPQVRCAIANSIWLRDNIGLAPDFAQRMREQYAAEVATLDFNDPGAAAIINDWVAAKTQGKIKDLVTPDIVQLAILILINAIYFKGIWTQQFDKAKTRRRRFTRLDGSHKRHPMMSQSGRYDYFEDDLLQAVRLPYGQRRLSMYVLLPKPKVPFQEFQRSLTDENWQRWIASLSEMEGDLVLPRFKVEYGVQLNNALTALGMGVAFSPLADFQGMGAGPLTISHVIHKTFIEVNEEGTEAAAATAVVFTRAMLLPVSRFKMVVNRPFFCAIRDDQTGALLFMGFIVEPQ